MILTQNEEVVLVAIDTLTSENKTCTVNNIAECVDPPLAVTDARMICRRLLGKGYVSFVRPRNADPYIELTSIGDIYVKQLIAG